MDFKTATISFTSTGPGISEKKIQASFAFSQYKGALDKNTKTFQGNYPGYEWLGVRTEPFDSWLETLSIEFCPPDEEHGTFQIDSAGGIAQEGEWLWFPVSKANGVETYYKHSSSLT